MKKFTLLSIIMLVSLLAFAQQPLTFPYQALVRDATGNPLPNQPIGAKITLLQDSITGTEVYTETHPTTTNNFGQLELLIGTKKPTHFDTINWGAGTMFIKLEVDLEGGNDFKEIGTHQLLAVPYAKYAEEGSGWKKTEGGISYLDGNVGVGMSAEEFHALTIREYSQSTSLKIFCDADQYGYIYFGDDNQLRNYIRSTHTGYFAIGNETSGKSIVITPDGNVGIGNSYTPSEKLEIYGGGLSVKGRNSINAFSNFYNMIQFIGQNHGAIVFQPGTQDELMFGFHSNGSFYWAKEDQYLMQLTNGGSLITYNDKFSNRKSRLNRNSKGILSLVDLEKEIEKNNNLPGIPTNEQFKQYGIEHEEVLEMLLTKIEELTLYTIQQQKEIEAQNHRFEKLEAEIENLKNK